MRHTQVGGAGALQHRVDLLDLFLDLLLGAVGFDDQDGLRIERIAGLDVGLHRRSDRLVHYLHPTRDDTGRDHVGDRLARLLDTIKRGQDRSRFDGRRQQSDRDFGGDAQHAFRAGDERKQVVPGCVERLATDFQQVPINGVGPQGEDIVYGQAVLEAVHPAGILRDVATDGAGNLRRGVRREIHPVRLGRLGYGQVAHAGLNACRSRKGVDGQYAVELRQRQHDSLVVRHRATGQTCPRAARHHRHPHVAAQPEH